MGTCQCTPKAGLLGLAARPQRVLSSVQITNTDFGEWGTRPDCRRSLSNIDGTRSAIIMRLEVWSHIDTMMRFASREMATLSVSDPGEDHCAITRD